MTFETEAMDHVYVHNIAAELYTALVVIELES